MRKLLVTLSLALPFSLYTTLALADKVILSDQLLFRLNNRAIFFLDLVEYADHLKTFHCLYPKSQLLGQEQLKPESWMEFIQHNPVADMQIHRPLILKMKRTLMRQLFANSQNLSVQRGFERELPLSSCQLESFESWPSEVQSLVQAELYWLENHESSDVDLAKIKALIEHELLF
jgi:hypothetical protein